VVVVTPTAVVVVSSVVEVWQAAATRAMAAKIATQRARPSILEALTVFPPFRLLRDSLAARASTARSAELLRYRPFDPTG
jgi:hypothetical protein